MSNNNPQQQQQQRQPASEAGSQLGERVEQSADEAAKKVEQTANAALQRVRDARQQAETRLEQQRAQLSQRIRRLGKVLSTGGETISTDDPFAQTLLHEAGERIDRLAEYVAHANPSDLADDVQMFARRRPGMFFGGAFLLGLTLGRFAKSTTSELSQARQGERTETEAEDFSEGASAGSVAVQRTRSVGRRTGRVQGTGAPSGSGGSEGTTPPYSTGSSAYGSVGTGSSSVGTGSSYGGGSSSHGASQGGTSAASTSGPATTTQERQAGQTKSTGAHDVSRGQGAKS